jgi:hypothetical protein
MFVSYFKTINSLKVQPIVQRHSSVTLFYSNTISLLMNAFKVCNKNNIRILKTFIFVKF